MVAQERTSASFAPSSRDPIPHYHGDVLRQLLIAAVVLILVTAPFYSNSLKVELPFMVLGALVLASLAAMANPHKPSVFILSVIAAGVGFVIYQMWALNQYAESSWLQFILREIIAIVFLTAFYFSLKTVRSFALHTIGRRRRKGEFGKERSLRSPEVRESIKETYKSEFLPWFLQNRGDAKRRASSEGQAAAEEGSSSNTKKSEDETPPL